jgi:methionyl-tRNA synthetase
LEGYVKANSGKWRQWVLDETKGWLKKGLEPRAITRDLDWGVEIPVKRIPKDMRIDDVENKRIYVWFDAVIGYLSASIEWTRRGLTQNETQTNVDTSWEDWWKNKEAEHYYFMGKDNLIFHTLFWPGQLHSYDEKLHLPNAPIINQFLNLEGQKFSKSRGVTIASDYMADTYGNDVLRFYLAMIMPENADANFDWADFVSKNNNILIATVGNFINRALTLAKDIDFKEADMTDVVDNTIQEFLTEGVNVLEKECSFKKYADALVRLADFGNKYIAKEEPWNMKDAQKKAAVMHNAVCVVIGLLVFFKSLMPDAYEVLSQQLGIHIKVWDEKMDIQKILRQVRIAAVAPLFKKIEERVVEEERTKLHCT